MANTFLTMDVIAKRALATLYNNIVLAGLVNRDYQDDFGGKVGDTITVRVPPTFVAKTFDRSAGIVIQDATEASFEVKLDTLLDVSFAVTTEDLTLQIDDFQNRLLAPAMEAIAQDVDGRLAEALVDAAESAGGGGTATVTNGKPRSAFRRAKAVLSRNNLPLNERYAVLSPEGVEVVTGDDVLERADASGSTDALIDGWVNRVSGFETYESQTFGFGPNDKGQADGVAFHRSAVALVSRTLEKPMGVAADQVAIASYKGLGLRVVKEYDINKKQDVISVDTLIGVKTVRKAAAVQLDFGQGS